MTSFEYDGYGNVTKKNNYGYYEDENNPVDGDEKWEEIAYYYDTSRWIVSLPHYSYLYDGGGVLKLIFYSC